MDAHTHLIPLVHDAGSRVKGPALRKLQEPAALLEHLATAELDSAIVSLPPPFYGDELSRDACRAWVEAMNDGLEAVCAAHAALRSLAFLPLSHPEVAVAEYERVANGAHVGVCISAGGHSPDLSDPRLAPLWEALDRDERMAFLHPGQSPDARLTAFYLHNLLGNPFETALAAAQLIFGGVLSRYSRIRFLLAHGGGALIAVLGRMNRAIETKRPGVPELAVTPVELAKRFYVDCITHDRDLLELSVATFGRDRVVIGSDWPFPMGTPGPRDAVAHLPVEARNAMIHANAIALLGQVAMGA